MPLSLIEPVWKVARYTSAAPVLFGESDDYVDGGVLANNPSESGLTKIQDFHRSRGEKLPISLVVSVGCGKYPRKELGCVDVFSGAEAWLDVRNVRDRTTNFMSLLTYAVSLVMLYYTMCMQILEALYIIPRCFFCFRSMTLYIEKLGDQSGVNKYT